MNKLALQRMATRLELPLEHNPALEDEHGLCGCVECYLAWTATAPPPSKLEQRVQPVLLAELFHGGARSSALQLLQEMVAEEKASQREKARKPRKAERGSREALEQFRANYIHEFEHERGWIKAACNFFGIDRKTLYNRMKME